MKILRYQEGIIVNTRCSLIYKRSTSFTTIKNECECFTHFISFINGRWTQMFCIEVGEEYKIYDDPYIQSFQYHSNKFSNNYVEKGLDIAYSNFSKMWKVSKSQSFIRKIVEWYSSISITQIRHEGSIILGQTTLELMYNYLIKDENVYLSGRDADDIATENKIRLLLKHFEIKTILPYRYTKLVTRIFKNSVFIDGPMLIAKVRNAFVHGNLESDYFNLEKDEIYLVYDLVTAYIELVMIKLLDIKLEYHSRLKEFEK